jgi:hypothetical protein
VKAIVDSKMTETSLNGLSTHLIKSRILSVVSRGAAFVTFGAGFAAVLRATARLTAVLATGFFAVTITQPKAKALVLQLMHLLLQLRFVLSFLDRAWLEPIQQPELL